MVVGGGGVESSFSEKLLSSKQAFQKLGLNPISHGGGAILPLPTSTPHRKLKFGMQAYFNHTRRNMREKN